MAANCQAIRKSTISGRAVNDAAQTDDDRVWRFTVATSLKAVGGRFNVVAAHALQLENGSTSAEARSSKSTDAVAARRLEKNLTG
jgi:hypothetical protein